MIKAINKLTLATILAAVVVGLPLCASAQSTNAAPAAPAVPAKVRGIPFHGKLDAVDKAAKTITLDGKAKKRTFEVTGETKITKGKSHSPATLDDATVGEDVTGSFTKEAGGKMVLKSLYLDPAK